MSSPMYDLPEHFPIPIDANGDGPADSRDTVGLGCSCGCEWSEEHSVATSLT